MADFFQRLLLLASALVATSTAKKQPPNVVLLFLDDTGWGDLGANWDTAASPSETPRMDDLAKRALRLTDFHAGASVCTPSRAALMTGRLGARTGITHNSGTKWLAGLPRSEPTIAEVVKQVGYDTMMLGKWHLGFQPGFHPSFRGFDEYFGLPFSNDVGCLDGMGWNWINGSEQLQPSCPRSGAMSAELISGVNLPSKQQREAALAVFGDEWEPFGLSGDTGCQASAPGPAPGPVAGDIATPLYHSKMANCSAHASCTYSGAHGGPNCCNQDIVEQPVNLTTLNERYVEQAIKYIASHSSSSDAAPYFMYVAFAHMHVPQAYESKWFDSSTRKSHFGDALREVDDAIGRIVDAIDEHDKSQNTLVFITADNGPWNVKCTLTGSQGPFAGQWVRDHATNTRTASGKFTVWEGGHREIGLAYWPGKIRPGVSDVLASTMDLMPTVAALAGAALPKDRTFDGLDLSPVFFNGATQHHEFLFHPGGGGLNAGRFGPYKVFWKTAGTKDCGHEDSDLPFEETTHNIPLVFDLSKDPAESTPINVSSELHAHFEKVRNATLLDIQTTFHSIPDYSQGTLKEQQPCCNVDHVVCRCQEASEGSSLVV